MLLAEREEDTSEAAGQLHDIVRNQGELFQKMMTDFGQFFTSEAANSKPKSKPKEEDDEDDRPDKPDSND